MDFLNFITAIHHRLGVDIPEIDYPKLVTIDGAVSYLASHCSIAQRGEAFSTDQKLDAQILR